MDHGVVELLKALEGLLCLLCHARSLIAFAHIGGHLLGVDAGQRRTDECRPRTEICCPAKILDIPVGFREHAFDLVRILDAKRHRNAVDGAVAEAGNEPARSGPGGAVQGARILTMALVIETVIHRAVDHSVELCVPAVELGGIGNV